MGSSRSRARTCVPCIGRWILNHCTTREVRSLLMIKTSKKIAGKVATFHVPVDHLYVFGKMSIQFLCTFFKNCFKLLRFTLSYFQIYSTVFLIIVMMVYLIFPELIYLIAWSLYLLTTFTHFAAFPLATTNLSSFSMCLALFTFHI